MNALQAAVTEAIEEFLATTAQTPDALFGERIVEATDLPPSTAHAMEAIEGAATALGLTALELLDQLDAP